MRGFVEGDGYVSIEAEHYTHAVDAPPIHWVRIPGLGRTLSGMTAFPVTALSRSPGGDGPQLEYRIYLFAGGDLTVRATFSPTLDFHATGLSYAVSFDDEPPQIANLAADTTLHAWERGSATTPSSRSPGTGWRGRVSTCSDSGWWTPASSCRSWSSPGATCLRAISARRRASAGPSRALEPFAHLELP